MEKIIAEKLTAEIKLAIRSMLNDRPELMAGQIAAELSVTELEVVSQLPQDQFALLSLIEKDSLLE